MGKIKEQQLEMFEAFDINYEDVSEEVLAFEDSALYYDMNPDWNDASITYSVEYNDTMTPITLAEFEQNIVAPAWAGINGLKTNMGSISWEEKRDYIMWEETKPLTTQTESDMLRKEIQELNQTLYSQYKRVAELTEEVNSLKKKLEQVTNIHSNSRKF